MKNPFSKKPWLWVVVAFVVLIAAWGALIYVSVNNAPETIPLEAKPAPGWR